MAKRIGKRTVELENPVLVKGFASAVGPKESEGPLAQYFDVKSDDEFLGEESFEKAESKLQQLSVMTALKKCGLEEQDIDLIFAGDLLNQCIGSAYGLRDFGIPFVGLYGACSTMALSLLLASMSIESGVAERAVAVTSSHFCSSERQFRFPLEYGGQRPPTAQWTVTGSGAIVLENGKRSSVSDIPNAFHTAIAQKIPTSGDATVCTDTDTPTYTVQPTARIRVKALTIGKIIDLKVTDMNNMGAAMAPAAADTIASFLSDTRLEAEAFDLIVTGDLGVVGSKLLLKLLAQEGIALTNHNDCGKMVFDLENQDVHAGGSGCGCSASVLCSYILGKMSQGEMKNVLFCATGALMSPTASMQGESIPSIAHLLWLCKE